MPKITEVYDKYNIDKMLLAHQLRVAAVAKLVCDNFTKPVDTGTVITACLLHDMGNILKYDFSQPGDWYQPKGKEYWRQVQKAVATKYNSNDEHEVTLKIAKELKVSQAVLDCIKSIDFGRAIETYSGSKLEPKICSYADLRVTPLGVVSLRERLDEGARRYKNRPDKWLSSDIAAKIHQACFDNEAFISRHCRLKLSDITDELAAPIAEQLKAYEI
jgi:hypothetical protein